MNQVPTDREDENPDTLQIDMSSVESTAIPAGSAIPGYEIEDMISRGGQATVFIAVHKRTGKRCAVKVMHRTSMADAARATLDQEVKALAELDHPNIVQVIDMGELEEGQPYFVMEYVRGESIRRYAERLETLPPRKRLKKLLGAFMTVCEALHTAHLRGIVHRDLKPGNILVDHHHQPRILDFGLAMDKRQPSAKRPGLSVFAGTLAWSAPEQVAGLDGLVDPRTDVYALGLLLYVMISGTHPYRVPTTLEEARQIISQTQPTALAWPSSWSDRGRKIPLSTRNALGAIVMKALEKDPARRYQGAGELGQDIRRLLEGKDVDAFSESPASLRSRWIWIAAALGAALLLVESWLLIRPRLYENRDAAAATEKADVWGYTIESGTVRFEFSPGYYEQVRTLDGTAVPMPDADAIEYVALVGPFNGWVAGDPEWRMEKSGRTRYEISIPVPRFEGMDRVPFQFVINGTLAVIPPRQADNRELSEAFPDALFLSFSNRRQDANNAPEDFARWRKQIQAAWPGLGAGLTRDRDELQFSFLHLPSRTVVKSLEPLRGIPLDSLDMGKLLLDDFTPLSENVHLETIDMDPRLRIKLFGDLYAALEKRAYLEASALLGAKMDGLRSIPAFSSYENLVRKTILALEQMDRGLPVPSQAVMVFQQRRYLYVSIPMTWTRASEFCTLYGAHLACVTSSGEQRWIRRTYARHTLGIPIWLGGRDLDREGAWTWETGEEWLFENWGEGEPDGNSGTEHALVMSPNGYWADEDGEALRRPFIMEWPADPGY